MDSRKNQDRLSNLPNILLVLILSYLPYKEVVKTCVLAKRWKTLYRDTTNVSLKESEFVKSDNEETRRDARVSFVCYLVKWVLNFTGEAIESFELCLSKPVGFETEIINSVIEFVVSKKVKNLVLDFSDPSWVTSNQTRTVFQLPQCVYNLVTLESLKLFACGFVPSRLDTGSMKSLCFGWIQLGKIESLIIRSPLLESLTIQNCSNVGLEMIARDNNRLTELIIEKCGFATEYSTFDVSNIQIFKYSGGKVHHFQFMEENRDIKEANLDFSSATEYDDGTGTRLGNLLYDLKSAKKLTVCPFLTQLIKDGDDPDRLNAPMETRTLVMKTNMQPSEFVGIRLMINNCPELETLSFVMVPPRAVSTTALGFDPDKYWDRRITYNCLKTTLKVVEVKQFAGGLRECQVLQYLIRYGRVLERVDLYLSSELDEGQKILARAAATMIGGPGFVKGSSRLTITLHNV